MVRNRLIGRWTALAAFDPTRKWAGEPRPSAAPSIADIGRLGASRTRLIPATRDQQESLNPAHGLVHPSQSAALKTSESRSEVG